MSRACDALSPPMVARIAAGQSFDAPNETCLCRSILEAHQPLTERCGLSNLRHR